QRRVIVSERANFPTDLYIAESLCREIGWDLELLEADDIGQRLNEDVALLMLTHVNYRTGRMHDMAALTAQAHAAGVRVVWDLAHADRFWQPLAGWMGHAAPFEFTPGYRPAAGIARYLCGTPPVLSLAALECGVDTLLAAEPFGGMAALRAKSVALTELYIAL